MAHKFVHLHVHSHYSLLDGATRIEPLLARAKALGMPAVAITDHGNLFGAVEFYAKAHKAGVKPIIGCETYLAAGDRRGKDPGHLKESYHQLLLAMNLQGYRNLIRLSTIGYTEGFYRKPRIDKQVLREFSEGLICTSTCLSGEIPQALLRRDRKEAEALAKTYLEIFGPDRFFIELQDHGLAEQNMLNPELADLARKLGVGVIATNDVHYLNHEDADAHDVLCCINTGSRLSDEDRFRFPNDQFYFKTPEEMAALFPAFPEALENTARVADMCALELDLSSRHAPVFRVPDEVAKDDGTILDDAAYLRKLVYEGATERYRTITPELRERIDYELDVITKKGFASYFLIVWDCADFARRRGIPVGARGSGCSSVVAYCLRISSPDPIRYGLYFERFLDPDRDEMPDIDLDICQNGRAKVIEYVREKYGHVAQIITFGTLKAKAAVKDVARAVGMGFERANELTRLIPGELHMTLDKALGQEPELRKRYEEDEEVRKIVDLARRLEGVARNAGVHAAGVVVADKPLVEFLPLYKAAGQDTLVTQYDGPTVERVGLLKMDFLGLRTLTTLERARLLAERSSGGPIDIERIDLSDPKVYALFSRGDTRGIFQFESGGMRDVLVRMKPNRIEDLIAANALYRPGPMAYIADYIARKHGASWTTPHPLMSEVLAETYGIMVYQEQVSRLVNRLGGIELKKAFRLAKAISKKNTAMIESMRGPFLNGCEANGLNRKVAQQVFEDILKFGGYAFNKAHSTGYALIAYQTAWMKTYFPTEFMAALMTFEMSSTDKVAEYREACREMGIRLEPPNINESEFDFTVHTGSVADGLHRAVEAKSVQTDAAQGAAEADFAERGARPDTSAGSLKIKPASIRFGLGAIKGVGAKAVAAIVEERNRNGPFANLFDFCERVDLTVVNRAAIQSLIYAGAFDCTGAMRKAVLHSLEGIMAAGQRVQHDRRRGQFTMFGEFTADVPLPAPSQALEVTDTEWSEAEMLAREKDVLGFYITKHPLAHHEAVLSACATASTVDLARRQHGNEVILGGMVSTLRTVLSKRGRNAGRRMGIVTLEDLRGRVEAVVFSDDLNLYRPLLVPDRVVFLQGTVDRKREEPSLKVTRVVAVEDAAKAMAQSLILTLRDGNGIQELVSLLRSSRGECPVYINVETPEGLSVQIQCAPHLKVCCTPELLGALARLLGSGFVCVLGPIRSPIPFAVPAEPVLAVPAAAREHVEAAIS